MIASSSYYNFDEIFQNKLHKVSFNLNVGEKNGKQKIPKQALSNSRKEEKKVRVSAKSIQNLE